MTPFRSLNHLTSDATRNLRRQPYYRQDSLNHLTSDATRNQTVYVHQCCGSLNHLTSDATRNCPSLTMLTS